MSDKQEEIDDFYRSMGHTHTGSLDHLTCWICNPNVPKPKPTIFIYNCIKCGKQFAVKKKKKKKKQLCKNCK